MIKQLAPLALCLAFLGCETSKKDSNSKPAGTPTDPVEVCERLTDVCRYQGSQLGVCIEPMPDKRPASCEGKAKCLVCTPQH